MNRITAVADAEPSGVYEAPCPSSLPLASGGLGCCLIFPVFNRERLAAPARTDQPSLLSPVVFGGVPCLCDGAPRSAPSHRKASSLCHAPHPGMGRDLSSQRVVGDTGISLRRYLSLCLGWPGAACRHQSLLLPSGSSRVRVFTR